MTPPPQRLTLISAQYFKPYALQNNFAFSTIIKRLNTTAHVAPPQDFSYYLLASSLYSSKIEGNTLDANSYFRQKAKPKPAKKKEINEIDQLTTAYQYATQQPLNQAHFLYAHKILSKTILPTKEQGKIRTVQVGIRDQVTLKPVYLAVEPQFVEQEMNKLFADIQILLTRKLTYKQTFYYASMIHLWIAAIHPFTDGNGRAARLIEKWFLAQKIGMGAWAIPAEKYYWDNRPHYYQNIAIGYNYYALHWQRCLPFLNMLPQALLLSQ